MPVFSYVFWLDQSGTKRALEVLHNFCGEVVTCKHEDPDLSIRGVLGEITGPLGELRFAILPDVDAFDDEDWAIASAAEVKFHPDDVERVQVDRGLEGQSRTIIFFL